MIKRILLILMGGIFVFGISKLSYAMMCGSHEEHKSQQRTAQSDTEHQHGKVSEVNTQTQPKEVIDVGNKICPVSGEEIKEDEVIKVEHEGKIYNFCCKACVKDFKKDPQKYIKKVEEELKARSKEETETTKMAPEPISGQGMHEGHHQGTHE